VGVHRPPPTGAAAHLDLGTRFRHDPQGSSRIRTAPRCVEPDVLPAPALSPVPVPAPLPLPARPRLRRAALHRAPDVLQFGADPSNALAVDGLTPPLVRMVDGLDGTRPLARVLAEAVAAGAAPGAARDLLERLDAAGLLVATPRADSLPERRVVVRGGGRVAVSVGCLLAAAGVGRVLVETEGTVVRDDVGTGLLAGDVGRPAQHAVEEAVSRASLGSGPPGDAPARRWLAARADLVVLADGARPDPIAAQRLVLDGRAHLPVSAAEDTGSLGPLVEPGATPCLRCEDLVRTDADPAWPRVAAELAGRRTPVPVALAAATAAAAVAEVLTLFEGDVPAVRAAVLDLAADGTRRLRPALRHRECGCRALTVRPAAGRHPVIAA